MAYGHPFAQTGITFRSVIGITYKIAIQNRHSKAPVAPFLPQTMRRHFGAEKPLLRTLKLRFRPSIAPIPRFSGNGVSLDYVNRRRGLHMESACHGNRKSCSVQREISSTGPKYCRGACVLVLRLSYPSGRTRIFVRPGIGTAREAPIRNPHFDSVGTRRGQHTESACHGDRKSCSAQHEISSTGRRYGCANIADIVTPPIYSHPFSERNGRGQHTESACHGDRMSCSAQHEISSTGHRYGCTNIADIDSLLGPKFRHGACVLVHRLSYPSGRTQTFVRPGIRIAREAPIRNPHFDPVGTRSHSVISGPAPKFLSRSVVAGRRCDRIRTPLRSNGHNFPLGYRYRL
ncbi:hypothetical protein Taro_048748 [Colocasia esculenta]|uniref:Uncharacterized protein n=1 Tax=Colocasia esculenta TaxID=4460 RepID=A0A843X905_COLES|nr:hypothetical protein [Colocasia esculenta]